jgi:hypothetical protein
MNKSQNEKERRKKKKMNKDHFDRLQVLWEKRANEWA